MDNCIFCKIVQGDIPSKKVYEDENVLAFNDPAFPCLSLIHISMREVFKDAEIVKQLSDRLHVSRDEMMMRFDALETRVKAQQDEIKRLQRERLSGSVSDHNAFESEIGPFKLLSAVLPNCDAEMLREAGDRFRDKVGKSAVILLASCLLYTSRSLSDF